jgi:hypothetical protein
MKISCIYNTQSETLQKNIYKERSTVSFSQARMRPAIMHPLFNYTRTARENAHVHRSGILEIYQDSESEMDRRQGPARAAAMARTCISSAAMQSDASDRSPRRGASAPGHQSAELGDSRGFNPGGAGIAPWKERRRR